MGALARLLDGPPEAEGGAGAAPAVSPFDAAVTGGAAADRVGFAFAAGYRAALRAALPGLAGARAASLCVTEAGGARPRDLRTTLARGDDGLWRPDGEKRFSPLSAEAELLLVAATSGDGDAGRPRIRVACVDARRAGVTLTPLPPLAFAPEIGHAEVRLAGVLVADGELVPGDGYEGLVKPFRTVEDVYVHAAVAAYLVAVARRRGWPREIVEALCAAVAALETMAAAPALAPSTHVALAGVLRAFAGTVRTLDALWGADEDAEAERWRRDRPLLAVAERAREARREAAWRRCEEREKPGG